MPENQTSTKQQSADVPGQYASVNGLNLYYEIHGSGEPLILLHGGVLPFESDNDHLVELAKHRQVIAVHMQGHGHTPDIDRPLRTESLADDIAALITQLDLAPVDLVGYSLGGGVALHTAIRHPAQIRKLVVVSAAMSLDGWYPEGQDGFVEMKTKAAQFAVNLEQSPYGAQYPSVDWEQLFTKLGTLTSSPYDWSDQVEGITAPTMLVFADADSIRPEHIVEMYRRLGGGQRDPGLDGSLRPTTHLAIVPGTTHYNLVSTPQVAQLVEQFLEAPLPAAGSISFEQHSGQSAERLIGRNADAAGWHPLTPLFHPALGIEPHATLVRRAFQHHVL